MPRNQNPAKIGMVWGKAQRKAFFSVFIFSLMFVSCQQSYVLSLAPGRFLFKNYLQYISPFPTLPFIT